MADGAAAARATSETTSATSAAKTREGPRIEYLRPALAPDLLILGAAAAREPLARRVISLGYRAATASAEEFAQRGEAPLPPALVLCLDGCAIRPLLRDLRRDPRGLGIPVVLYGPLGAGLRDLADVLELGADRFLVTPVSDSELYEALLELLGPAEPTPLAQPPNPTDTPLRQRDPLLAQLKRTLAALDELREELPAEPLSRDGIDLESISLGGGPELEHATSGGGEPAETPESPEPSTIPALGRRRAHPATTPTTDTIEAGTTRAPRRPSATLRLEPHEGSQTTTQASTPTSTPASTPAGETPGRAGTLARSPLPDLVARLAHEGFTGTLELERDPPPGRLRVRWRGGALLDAEGDRPEDRLSSALRRRGLVDAAGARALHRRLGRDRLAELDQAIAAGAVKPRERDALAAELLAELVTAAFAWEGRWSLAPAALEAEAETPSRPLAVAAVLAEGLLLEFDEARLRARLPAGDRCPRQRAEDDPRAPEIPPPAAARPLLPLDGSLSIDELAALGGQPLLAWLEALRLVGRVEFIEPAARPEDPAEPGDLALDRQRITARLAVAREGDYFALLEVDEGSSRGAILRAHLRLRRAFAHERLEPSSRVSLRSELHELMAALDEARDVLSDETLRAAYLALRDP